MGKLKDAYTAEKNKKIRAQEAIEQILEVLDTLPDSATRQEVIRTVAARIDMTASVRESYSGSFYDR